MAKLTLDNLKKLREEKKRAIDRRESAGKEIEIVVGMGTCGIAAGAKKTLEAFITELDKRNLTDIIIRQSGCMGFCSAEPTVEVRMPGLPPTTYKKVDPDTAVKIVQNHILNKSPLTSNILER
jgi:NADP-reducing hydrogenase subunit HndB